MKIALVLLNQFRRAPAEIKDESFERRLRSMTSPATTGPRLRRVMPPSVFSFRRTAATA
ncbi:MAG: hypothetical protein ACKVPY_13095 [Paracoccaceae bacterium]